MAARRITQSSINWSALAERVPSNQKANFLAFKSKSDVYLRGVMANPEVAPKLDWAYYKNLIPISGLVDKFQQSYDGLKVPYPTENISSQIDAQGSETKSEIEVFKKLSNDRIDGLNKKMNHLKSLLPFDQMTMEDYRDAFPDAAIDPINRPTFWPHLPEDQVGYKPKDAQQAEH